MQTKTTTHTHPPAGGWPGGSATTDRLLPCHLNKPPTTLHYSKQDVHVHTLCCRLLFCAGTDPSACGSGSAQTLLFHILLPGPWLLPTLVWGKVRNKCQKELGRASREHHFFNGNLIKLLQGSKCETRPLFLFSRSLSAARIRRLSSKSAAVSSWRDEQEH